MSNVKMVSGFLAGAAIGAILGVLFAPAKGSDTRKKIATKTGDITDSVKNSLGDLTHGIKEAYAGTKNDIDKILS